MHRELAVHHVVLRHHADSGAQRGVLGVDVVALERDGATGRMGQAGDLLGERRLAGAGRADHRGQRAGAGVQRDVVQQGLVALDGPCQAVDLEAAGAGVGGVVHEIRKHHEEKKEAKALVQAGRTAAITTTIEPAGPYYFAEDYHQQYLAKNPGGYCGLGGTGVACPAPGVGVPS